MTIKIVFNSVVLNSDHLSAALSPTDKGWNDFGYNFHAFVRFYDPDGRDPVMMRSFVIPFGDDGSPLKNFGNWYDARSEDPRVRRGNSTGRFDPTVFNFMFATEGCYARLLEWCRSEHEYESILESLNDITWLMRQDETSQLIARTTISSASFRLGVGLEPGSVWLKRSRSAAGLRRCLNGAACKLIPPRARLALA